MRQIGSRISLLSRIAEVSYSNHKKILIVTCMFFVIASFLIRGLRIDTDMVRLIESDKPRLKTFVENKKMFGESSPLMIILETTPGEPIHMNLMVEEMVKSISQWDDVSILSNQQHHSASHQLAPWALRAAIFNSPDPVFRNFVAKFSTAAIQRQLLKTQRRLITVSDPDLRERINLDVLNVFPLVKNFFGRRMTAGYFNAMFARPGNDSSQILLLQPRGEAENSAYCIDLISRLNQAFARLRNKYGSASSPRISFAGLHALTAQSTRVLKREMILITLVSAALLFLVLILSLRQFRLVMVCFIPLMVSIPLMLLVARLFFNPIYFITIGFAAIVLGLGLDAGIHLTARFTRFIAQGAPPQNAVSQTIVECGPPVFIGIASTAAAFAALMVTRKAGMIQFAGLTIIGVFTTFVVTLFLFPALIRWLIPENGKAPKETGNSSKRAGFFALVTNRHGMAFAVGCVLILAGIPCALKFSLKIDVTSLFPTNLEVWKSMRKLEKKFDTSFSSAVQVSIDAPTFERALLGQRQVDDALSKEVAAGKITYFDSPGSFLAYSMSPDRLSMAEARISSQRENFFAALKKNRIRLINSHIQYYDILQQSMQAPGQTLSDLRQYPQMARFLASHNNGVRLQTYIWPSLAMTRNNSLSPMSAAEIDKIVSAIDLPKDVTLVTTSTAHLLEKIQILVKKQFFQVSWLAFGLVVLCVWAFQRKVFLTVISLMPLGAALVLLLAAIVLLAIPITPAVIAFAAIVLGIGIDDAVHILARTKNLPDASASGVIRDIGPIITLTTVSTAIGFGSLMLSSHPVVSSIGQAVSIGVVACWLFTLLLLPTLISIKKSRNRLFGLVLVVLLTSGTYIHGHHPQAQKILQRIQRKMAATEAVSCRFSQTKKIQQVSGPVNLSGSILFQKPRFLKVQLRGDANMDVFVNPQTVTLVDLDLEEVETHPVNDLVQSDHWLSPMLMFIDPHKIDSDFIGSMVGDPRHRILRLVPKHKQSLRAIEFQVDNFLRVRWSRFRYQNGDMVDTRYTSWRKRKKVSEKVFQHFGGKTQEW